MEFPLAFGLQQVGLPLIVTSGKLENLCFLIDTGSSHNLLFDFVYKHFQDEFKLLENTQQAMGIEGHYVECPIIEAQVIGTINLFIIEYDTYPSSYGVSITYEDLGNSTKNENEILNDL